MENEVLSAYLPSTWKRIAATLADEIVMLPFYAPFIGIFLKIFWEEEDVTITLLQFALLLLIPAIYEFIFLFLMQATPGKWLLGLRVVPAEDIAAPLEWQQCLLRALSKRLSLFFSTAIFVVAFFRYDRTHLADWIAETRVVQSVPRGQRPKIRWVLGSIFVIYFVVEGWMAAANVAKSIEWKQGRVNISSIFGEMFPQDMDLEEEL